MDSLHPGLPVQLRQADGSLANMALPALEAYSLMVAGHVEVKMDSKRTRIKYLKLLPEEEIKRRKELEREAQISRGEIPSGQGCDLPSRLRIGVRRASLKQVIVEEDSFGKRKVVGEGEPSPGLVWEFCLASV